MERCCEIIDLCDVKTVKSEDTSATIPLDENGKSATTALTTEEDLAKKTFTEQWVSGQNLTTSPDSVLPNLENQIISIVPPEPVLPNDIVVDSTSCLENDDSVLIPPEVTELVNKECAIKLINSLVIYAINKCTEAELHRKVLSITPDIDPQINYRTNIGFQCIYERCVVLFYEALLDLTDIFLQFTISTQNILILWMYNMVENMCKAHSVDGGFLRRENYIERMLRDFTKGQKLTPEQDNLFYHVYQKTLPTPVVRAGAENDGPHDVPPAAKKARKPRVKKIKTVVTEPNAPTSKVSHASLPTTIASKENSFEDDESCESTFFSDSNANPQPDSTQSDFYKEVASSNRGTINSSNLLYVSPTVKPDDNRPRFGDQNHRVNALYNGFSVETPYQSQEPYWRQYGHPGSTFNHNNTYNNGGPFPPSSFPRAPMFNPGNNPPPFSTPSRPVHPAFFNGSNHAISSNFPRGPRPGTFRPGPRNTSRGRMQSYARAQFQYRSIE